MRQPCPGTRWLLAAVAACGLTVSAVAAGVAESTLQVTGRVRDVRALDVDGDSREEVVVLSVSGRSTGARRFLSVFWRGAGGRFAPRPGVTWELDSRIAALDVFPDGKTGDLYSLRDDGVQRHQLRRNRPVSTAPLLKGSFPHLVPPDDTVPLLDVVGPWSDGSRDLLVPGFPHPVLFPWRDGSYGDGIALPVTATVAYNPGEAGLRVSYRFPAATTAAGTAPDGKQVLFFERDRITVCDPARVHQVAGGGGFAEARVYPLEILTPEESTDDRDVLLPRLVDLEGDGHPDLVVIVYRESGVLEISGRFMIFRSRPDGSFPRRADQVLQVENGLYYMARILDLDGDGRLEISLPATRLGLWAYLKFLTSRKVSFRLHTLAQGEAGVFESAATSRDAFTFRLSESFHVPVVTYVDLTGDGIQDLAVGKGEDLVCVHEGVAGKDGHRFASRPRLCFPANPFDTYRDGSLDGREALMHFADAGDRRNRVTVTILEP
jgi:hypothetical protein